MNPFLPIYQRKLSLMQAAAPRATLHCLHEADGFSLFLGEAEQAGKHGIGKLEDKAGDPLFDPPILHLFIPLDQMPRFIEAVTPACSVALIDAMSADKVHVARHVMYAYFPRVSRSGVVLVGNSPSQEDMHGMLVLPSDASREEFLDFADKVIEEKDFWG